MPVDTVKADELSAEELAQLLSGEIPGEPELSAVERALLYAERVGCEAKGCSDAQSDTSSK